MIKSECASRLNTVYHYTLFCFQVFECLAIPFQAKNNVTSTLLALHLYKYHTKAVTRVLQIVTYAVREKGKVSFGRTMMQAIELLRLAHLRTK